MGASISTSVQNSVPIFEAHRHLYDSTPGLRVTKKRKKQKKKHPRTAAGGAAGARYAGVPSRISIPCQSYNLEGPQRSRPILALPLIIWGLRQIHLGRQTGGDAQVQPHFTASQDVERGKGKWRDRKRERTRERERERVHAADWLRGKRERPFAPSPPISD